MTNAKSYLWYTLETLIQYGLFLGREEAKYSEKKKKDEMQEKQLPYL